MLRNEWYRKLIQMGACDPSLDWVESQEEDANGQRLWESCPKADWRLWVFGYANPGPHPAMAKIFLELIQMLIPAWDAVMQGSERQLIQRGVTLLDAAATMSSQDMHTYDQLRDLEREVDLIFLRGAGARVDALASALSHALFVVRNQRWVSTNRNSAGRQSATRAALVGLRVLQALPAECGDAHAVVCKIIDKHVTWGDLDGKI